MKPIPQFEEVNFQPDRERLERKHVSRCPGSRKFRLGKPFRISSAGFLYQKDVTLPARATMIKIWN
jgi:hypothetical protein